MASSSESDSEDIYSDSDSGSDFDYGALGAHPYMFEPEAKDGDGDADVFNEKEDVEGRLGNNHWCTCSGGCTIMPVLREARCCKEIPKIVAKMDAYKEEDLDCITQHPGFKSVCLNKYVLQVAFYEYFEEYEERIREDATENQKFRHIAYRQLALWCWEYLGSKVRVPLPSCAVTKIRAEFPSEEGRGFEELT